MACFWGIVCQLSCSETGMGSLGILKDIRALGHSHAMRDPVILFSRWGMRFEWLWELKLSDFLCDWNLNPQVWWGYFSNVAHGAGLPPEACFSRSQETKWSKQSSGASSWKNICFGFVEYFSYWNMNRFWRKGDPHCACWIHLCLANQLFAGETLCPRRL